jgi:hypothetical protein
MARPQKSDGVPSQQSRPDCPFMRRNKFVRGISHNQRRHPEYSSSDITFGTVAIVVRRHKFRNPNADKSAATKTTPAYSEQDFNGNGAASKEWLKFSRL